MIDVCFSNHLRLNIFKILFSFFFITIYLFFDNHLFCSREIKSQEISQKYNYPKPRDRARTRGD